MAAVCVGPGSNQPLTARKALIGARIFYGFGTALFICGVVATPILAIYALPFLALGVTPLAMGIGFCFGGYAMFRKGKSLHMQERIYGTPMTRATPGQNSNQKLNSRSANSLGRCFCWSGVVLFFVGVVVTPVIAIYFLPGIALGATPLALGIAFTIAGCVLLHKAKSLLAKERANGTFGNNMMTVSENIAPGYYNIKNAAQPPPTMHHVNTQSETGFSPAPMQQYNTQSQTSSSSAPLQQYNTQSATGPIPSTRNYDAQFSSDLFPQGDFPPVLHDNRPNPIDSPPAARYY